MNNILFPSTLYVPNDNISTIPQKGLGNKKIIAYELKLISTDISEQYLKNIEALYKVQNIHTLTKYTKTNDYVNIYEYTSDIILAAPLNRKTFTLMYPNDIRIERYKASNLYAHYIVNRKNIINPNFKNILAKRNKSLILNKKIAEESKLIDSYTTNEIWLNKKYIYKLINDELKKYGKKIKPYMIIKL